jgi:hypothetical protein
MSKAFAAVFGLLLLSEAAAAPPGLEIPSEVKPANGYVIVRPKTTAKAVTYIALDGIYPFPTDLLADKRQFVLPAQGLAAGRYRFVAVGSLNDEHATAEFAVVVGNPPPPPPPGPTAGPTPGPTPTPTPTPDPPPPIAAPGFNVLIVLEKTQQHTLPPAQVAIAFGAETEKYVKSKDGDMAVLDKDDPGKALPKAWQDAIKRPRSSLPWVLISNGKTGYEGPLPMHVEEWKLLLKKYGGQ